MKVTKHQLCSSCRKIPTAKLDMSIEDFLDSVGYNHPLGYIMGNQMILLYLKGKGGCSRCI